jgi:hypothetical protein
MESRPPPAVVPLMIPRQAVTLMKTVVVDGEEGVVLLGQTARAPGRLPHPALAPLGGAARASHVIRLCLIRESQGVATRVNLQPVPLVQQTGPAGRAVEAATQGAAGTAAGMARGNDAGHQHWTKRRGRRLRG